MDLPLALAALLLLLLVLLAAPPAALLIALHLNRRRRSRLRKPRLTPPEPAAPALEPSAPAEEDEGGEEKRRRRRARRKQQQQKQGGDGAASQAVGGDDDGTLLPRPRFPLASVAGALQRRITARYDDLARTSQAQSLTIDQVPDQSPQPSLPLTGDSGKKRNKPRRKQEGMDDTDKVVAVEEEKGAKQDTSCPIYGLSGPLRRRITKLCFGMLSDTKESFRQVHEFLSAVVDARDELLQKSENTRRSITIRKAMLSNSRNGRSSHDHLRLCEQVDRLEFEYERLKKNANTYHELQERIRRSICYKMLEESNDEAEKKIREGAFAKGKRDTAFEDLLAVEKKDDAFWRRDGRLRSISDSM